MTLKVMSEKEGVFYVGTENPKGEKSTHLLMEI